MIFEPFQENTSLRIHNRKKGGTGCSGSGCGICYDSKSNSTVKRSGDRLAGTVTYKKKDSSYSFNVTFDVPVAPAILGRPLPSDGGDAGKAYMEFHRALPKQKETVIKKMVIRDVRERIEKAGKDNKA